MRPVTRSTSQDANPTVDQPAGHILVVNTDKEWIRQVCNVLQEDGYFASQAQSASETQSILQSQTSVIELLIVGADIDMAVFDMSRSQDPERPVVVCATDAAMRSLPKALSGGVDLIAYPFNSTELRLAVSNAMERRRLRHAVRRLSCELVETKRQLERHAAELNVIHDISSALSATAELDKLFATILDRATHVVGATYGSILLLDEETGMLSLEAATGNREDWNTQEQIPLDNSIAGHVAATGEPILIEDVETDERFRRQNRPQFETNSLIATPLKTPNAILGVLCLSDRLNHSAFSHSHLRLLSTLATQAAMAIDDARHYQEVRRRLTEATTLQSLADRLNGVERTGQMVMAVFAAFDELVFSDCLQWWRWDAESGSLHLDHDTSHPTHDQNGTPCTSPVNASLASDDRNCAPLLKDTLHKANWATPLESILTVPVRSSDHPLGVFAICRANERPFHENDHRIARLIGTQAERIFERQRALMNASRLVTMGKMISEISHDLRKPLTNIRGSLQVMMGDIPSSSRAQSILKETEKEVVRLAALVTELVDFSNPHRYRTMRRNPQPLILRAVELVGPQAQKNKITITTDMPAVLPAVFCDENQLTEAMLNILMNAVEAMSDGGNLKVSAAVEPDFQGGGDHIVITVADTGPGMSRRELDRIFERYYTTKTTGTGLGLAIVQRIIGAFDGTVRAESAPGQGTTFYLRFPVR